MIKLRRGAAVVAAALALATGGLAIPAAAATSNAASGTRATFTAPRVAPPTGLSVSPNFSSCSINVYGPRGAYICNTQWLTETIGLTSMTFVIGTNWAIWEDSNDGDPWWSLGGQALHTTNNGVYEWSYSPLVIWTWGTDGQQWCNSSATGVWGGWYRCYD